MSGRLPSAFVSFITITQVADFYYYLMNLIGFYCRLSGLPLVGGVCVHLDCKPRVVGKHAGAWRTVQG